MVLENVCPPALLYLAFSIIQIIIDMYRGDTIQAFFKFIVMIIFTIVLNAICSSGMTIISWFIVFIPFILMTYITTILFFIFGINPSKIQESNKKCNDTQFGCCDDGVTAKQDLIGRSCPRMRLVNTVKIKEPTPANNKDRHYLYPRGRSWRDYSLGGESVSTNKKYWRDANKDSDYYYSKRLGKYVRKSKKDITPKGAYSKSSYWKSRLNNSYWDDEDDKKSDEKKSDEKTADETIVEKSKSAGTDYQDKTVINYLLSLLTQMQPNTAAPATQATQATQANQAAPTTTTPPVSTAAPVLSGTTTVGSTITATNGTWSGSPTPTYTYAWLRGTTPISGEVSNTYIIKAADVGATISFRITATNSAGSGSASATTPPVTTSPATPSSPALTGSPPTLSGATTLGSTITAMTGTWLGSPTPTFTYEWFRGTTKIDGEVSKTYIIKAADIGRSIDCRITATNSEGSASFSTQPLSIPSS